MHDHPAAPLDHVWFWRARPVLFRNGAFIPDPRKGQRCRVVARGAMNSILVEFADGHCVVTSRYDMPPVGAGPITLRPYQSAGIESLRALLRAGKRRLLFVLPTGGGKTICFCYLSARAVERGKRVLIVVHREELLEQASEKLDAFGLPHGVHMANHPRWIPHAPVQIASVQTLARRLQDGHDKHPGQFDLLIFDEAHHCRATTWETITAAYPAATVLGFTATPWRTDGRGLGALFDDLVVAATVPELIALGALVPVNGFGFESPDLSAVKVSAGDYNQKQLAEIMAPSILTGTYVEKWKERAAGRQTIIFAVNIEQSQQITAAFRAAGVAAEHVDGTMPREQRRAVIQRFRSGQTLAISSCAVLTEGFDVPAASCAILLRPTKSPGLAMQMMGRVLRPAPGKTDALIHDHANVLMRHGPPDELRDYSLTDDRPKGKGGRNCPNCGRACVLSINVCPECGHVFNIIEDRIGEKREIEIRANGKVIDIDAIRKLRAEMGLSRDLSDEQIRRVARATRQQKAAEFLRLQQVATEKGFKPGFVGHQYRSVFGVWPRFSEADLADVEPARRPFLPLPLRRATVDASEPNP